MCYLLGAIKGDGCLSEGTHTTRHILKSGDIKTSTSNRSRVCFCTKDKDFMDEVIKSVRNVYGFSPPTWIYGGLHYMETSDKRVVNDLKSFNLTELDELSDIEKCAFLRGFFDAEGGSYYSHRWGKEYPIIKVGNTNATIMKKIQQILGSLSINSHIRKCTPKGGKFKDFYEVYIGRREDVVKFRDAIGFAIKRKMDRIKSLMYKPLRVKKEKTTRRTKVKMEKVKKLKKAESITEAIRLTLGLR